MCVQCGAASSGDACGDLRVCPIVHVAESTWPIIWLAGFAATLSADIVAGILTNVAIAFSEGMRMRFEHVLGIGLALTFAKTGLALTVVMVMTEYPAGLVVVAIPVAAAFLAGRAHVEVRRERDDMVKLQRATGLAQRSLHPDELLPLLLEHLREMFHADIAELVLPDEKAKDHLASRMGQGEPLRSSRRSTSTPRRACGRASSQKAKASCSLDRSATLFWLSTSVRWGSTMPSLPPSTVRTDPPGS